MKQVAVLGAGSFGTALAVHLARVGHDVRLWARDADLASEMARRRSNPAYLTELAFPPSVTPTSDLEQALAGCDLVVSVVPSHGTRDVISRAKPLVRSHAVIVSATKGLDEDSLLRPSEVIAAIMPGHRVVEIGRASCRERVCAYV